MRANKSQSSISRMITYLPQPQKRQSFCSMKSNCLNALEDWWFYFKEDIVQVMASLIVNYIILHAGRAVYP